MPVIAFDWRDAYLAGLNLFKQCIKLPQGSAMFELIAITLAGAMPCNHFLESCFNYHLCNAPFYIVIIEYLFVTANIIHFVFNCVLY